MTGVGVSEWTLASDEAIKRKFGTYDLWQYMNQTESDNTVTDHGILL